MSIISLEMENLNEKFNQRQMIMRGKRTKRSRPSVVSSSSSSGCSDNVFNVCFSISSPKLTSSGENNSACTEEDEDMANCLIMLAQSGGGGGGGSDSFVKPVITEEIKLEKYATNLKVNETATNLGKDGLYVYECKTCNRSFTSFQALGGHRASHKRPKIATDVQIHLVTSNNSYEKIGHESEKVLEDVQTFNKTSPSLSFHKSSKFDHKSANKVHECSICGSEFSSGQALGGHMRRHRSVVTSTTKDSNNNEKSRNVLELDLNLPAPEDDHRDTKFPFVFAGPALVGCHY